MPRAKTLNDKPKPGAASFNMRVSPTRAQMDQSIAAGGQCEPGKCWHKVAINAVADEWEPGAKFHIRIDAGHVKMNYKGWMYVADTPRHVKKSLMLFDKEWYDDIKNRDYSLTFRRIRKVRQTTPDRQKQINAARNKRLAAGSDENRYHRRHATMRSRVEGFSSVV